MMKTLELKIPPALLMLLFLLLIWGVNQLLPQFKYEWGWHEWAARAVFCVAVVFIGAGVISFKNAKTTVDPTRPEKATSMVTSGVYQVSRNPMYLGFFLILLASVIKLANPMTLMVLPLFLIYMNVFQIKPEEQALRNVFGVEYDQYCQQVRRWI